jgi:hypothetical protein
MTDLELGGRVFSFFLGGFQRLEPLAAPINRRGGASLAHLSNLSHRNLHRPTHLVVLNAGNNWGTPHGYVIGARIRLDAIP